MTPIERLRKTYYEFGLREIRSTAIERDQMRKFDREIITKLAAKGFFHLLVPSSLGGAGLSLREFAVVFESLAEGALDLPFVLGIGAHAIPSILGLLEFGDQGQRQRWLGEMLNGTRLGALCNSEPGAGTDLRLLKSVCAGNGDHGLLTTYKSAATNGGAAGALFVSAWHDIGQGERNLEVFLLDGAPIPQTTLEFAGFHTGITGSIRLIDHSVSIPESRLGKPGSGPRILKFFFDLERLMIPVILSGTLNGLRIASQEFAAREMRGKTRLLDNQFVQEKILKLYTTSELIRGLVSRAFETAKSSGHGGLTPAFDQAGLSSLKYLSVDLATEASIAAVELWGGRGYREDHFVQKFTRDVLGLKSLGGTREQHQFQILRELERGSLEKNLSEDTTDGPAQKISAA